MKTRNLIALAMVGLALSFTPALAQRGGGSRGGGGGSRGGGGGHSSSMSSSRGSYSGGSSSRSSYSGSSSRSSSSYSSPSRSSSPSSSSRSSAATAPSRSSHASTPAPAARGSYSGTPAGTRSTYSGSPARGSYTGSRAGTGSPRTAAAPGGGHSSRDMAPGSAPSTSSHGSAVHNTAGNPGHHGGAGTGYARPGRPGGVMPPSHRPIHPAPYFYHPWHGYVVHCHPIYWDPIAPRPWYWPGFWHYCNSYWYDYHVTDVVVVRQYVQDTYNVDMITYGISGDIMYAIVKDHGDTYLQVYDKDDHLLAEQKIHRKYCNMVIDSENGGCWISKKHNKDALLFIWADNQLLIYEAD